MTGGSLPINSFGQNAANKQNAIFIKYTAELCYDILGNKKGT